ncbi:peptidase S8/S53 domain-containing protein [Camillea tinctor]|nr:peptidase S8/S53 domain-containing protein [Camillea tinctor]
MKFTTAAVLFSLAAFSAAQEVELDDVPRACSQTCQDIVNLATTCDRQNNDNDAGERNCICNGTNAQTQATNCAACAKANGLTDNDNDLADLMNDCGWNYAAVSASTASATATSATGTGATASATTTGTGSGSSTTGAATDAAATSATSEGAAPAATAAVGGVLAGLMMALPAMLVIMKLFNLVVAATASTVLAIAPIVNQDHPDLIDNNYIVVMKKGVDPEDIQAHYTSVKATSAKLTSGMRGFVKHFQVHTFNAYHLECDNYMLEDIRGHELVDYIAQDSRMTISAPIPKETILGLPPLRPRNDSQTSPWGLGRISHRLPGITNYVTGDWNEFGGRAIWGTTTIDNESDSDNQGHGTATASIVGGNSVGVDKNTLLIAVKVLGSDGAGAGSSCIAGIDWAVKDAKNENAMSRSVINMSLRGGFDQATNDAIASAAEAGMVVVVAAGNENDDACNGSPSSAPDAITVAAIDEQDNRSSYSSWGRCVNIFAPGDNINTASFDGDDTYTSPSGTSVSAPHVAGIVTLLRARENLATAQQVSDRISEIATRDRVQDAHDSVNLIAFNGNPAEM